MNITYCTYELKHLDVFDTIGDAGGRMEFVQLFITLAIGRV